MSMLVEVIKPVDLVKCLHCHRLTRWDSPRALCQVCRGSKRIRGTYPVRRPQSRTEMTTPCNHCQRVRRHYSRGLCRSCYMRPEVREKFPTTGKAGVCVIHGLASRPEAPTKVPKPTGTLPGTLRRMAVYRGRLRRGECLFHEADARGCMR